MSLPVFSREALRRVDAADYPRLFSEADWGVARVRFQLGLKGVPRKLIGCVNVAAQIDGRWVAVQFQDGRWTMPGGTRELGESLTAAARRELMEEAGCRLRLPRFFGAWRCESTMSRPHQAHVPHPMFYRAVALAEGRLLSPPTNPPGAEQIAQVQAFPLSKAEAAFRGAGRGDLADLYRLAAFLASDADSG
ncbi:MAG: NUDIX domain-containing protein [Candidatus Poribacteria bacterium]|nr:NUDIX domain-containing protein [Candidatus Poribacteria bacterium]